MAENHAYARQRCGWQKEEEQILWEEIAKAAGSGQALKSAFDAVALKTGRKAGSIRNFYYISVKNGAAPADLPVKRALPFVPFEQDELHELVRAVLIGRTQGKSVRACVGELSRGDRTLALRYQNKYRSILKTRPEYIRCVMDELAAQGVAFSSDFTPVRRRRSAVQLPCPDPLLAAAEKCGAAGQELLLTLSAILQDAARACTKMDSAPDDTQAAG